MKTVKIKTGKKISADDWVKEKEAMKPYIKKKQFSFAVSDELHYRFHLACVFRGVNMKDVLIKHMEQVAREDLPQ